MAFPAGTALSGAMQGFGQGIQNYGLMQALQDQQRKRQAQGLAFQALLAGALGNTGGLPDGGAPPVPTGATAGAGGMPMPQAPAPMVQPPMPGQASVPDAGGLNTPVPSPPQAGGPLPMRGGMGLDFAFDPRSSPYTGDQGAPLPGNESAIPPKSQEPDFIEPPPAAKPAQAAPAPAPSPESAPAAPSTAAPAPQAQAPFPQPERATHLDLSRFFHSADPKQIAEAVMKAKPGVDPQTAMIAVEQLYKMGTQGSALERAQTAMLLNHLDRQGALTEKTREFGVTSGQRQQTIDATAANRQRLGQQFQQHEERLGSQFQQRMAILERSQNPQIRAQTAALRARRQAILDASKNAAGMSAPSEEQTAQIAAIDKQIEQLYTAEVKRMGGQVPATPMPMPAAPPQ